MPRSCSGCFVRPVALMLAANLVVAVCTAGRIDGGVINLGLAPALIVALLALALRSGTPRSPDRRGTADWRMTT